MLSNLSNWPNSKIRKIFGIQQRFVHRQAEFPVKFMENSNMIWKIAAMVVYFLLVSVMSIQD